jgi:hypothetical protein
MMKSISISILSFALLLSIGCNEAKQVTNSNEESTSAAATEVLEQEMNDKGFRKAVVIKTDADAPCDYQIQLEDSDMLDPSELDVTFRKHNLEVWIKYLGLRRQNRCDRNVPVDLLEIRKR